jgi:serpin B
MKPDATLIAQAGGGDTAAAATLFADDLLAALARRTRGNLVVAPLSVYDVLSLLAPGARGASAELLRRVLHTPADNDALLLDMVQLRNDLSGADAMLRIASAAWLQRGFAVRDAYRTLLTDAGAPPRLADFAGDPAGARDMVNAWIEENTAGRIRDMVAPGVFNATTSLVLADAIALDAPWTSAFSTENTRERAFHAPGADRSVQMMHSSGGRLYAEGPGYRAVRLAYVGGRLDALVVLPDQGGDPLAVLPAVTAPAAHQAFTEHHVDLALPRFELSSSVDLHHSLVDLGLAALFARSTADLSGIAGVPGDLVVDRALHQALLTVEESGTKGAAATVVTVVPVSKRIHPRTVSFTVDRPFLFAVVDRRRGVPVFVARVSDPRPPSRAARRTAQ